MKAAALEHRLACLLPNGLHARPATHLQEVASRFPAEVALVNERTGAEANAKSVLALLSAGIQTGDPMLLRVRGQEEEAAFAELTRFLREDFLACDEPLPAAAPARGGAPLPRALRAAAPEKILRGTVLCGGVAQGVIRRAEGLRISDEVERELAARQAVSAAEELAVFRQAAVAAADALEAERSGASGAQKEVLHAHIALLGDPSFAASVERNLAGDGTPAARAILAAVGEFSETLHRSSSAYLRERVLDLQDIGARLLNAIHGPSAVLLGPVLREPSIVVAESLTPGQFLALDREHLRGLVLQHSGATSHTVILARSFGVPTLGGVPETAALAENAEAILDADVEALLPEPNEAARRYYALDDRRRARTAARERAFAEAPGASRDGHALPLLANVSSAAEVAAAMARGAEGIGLFRTEMLYLGRAAPPSEDEQAAAYTEAVRTAEGRPVTLRTFDIGGDKPAPYFELPEEENPFLGCRGARLYGEFAELLKTQLRAMFRAAAHGPVRIMAPMISQAREMRVFRALVEEIQANFSGTQVLVGMMIEVPSAAFAVRECGEYADFFSLGTNDLQQYFFAAARDDARVAGLASPLEPAFLRFLRQTVDESHRWGKPVGLCGEMGEEAWPVLLGLKLDSVSLGASRIPAAKAELAALDFAACTGEMETLLGLGDSTEVRAHLEKLRRRGGIRPILDAGLIEAESGGATKHEAIKELTDLLAAAGRLGDAVAVEEAVWQREEAYSTGFGHGFAVPHCQSDHVRENSIAVVRLRHPVEWGSLDGLPVRIAILIALRSEDKGREHLRIFAKLSRLVMNEEFRARLEQAADASAIFSILASELDFPSPTQTL